MALTKKQEAFAQAILTEDSKSDAYRKAYDCDGMSDKSIHERASRLSKEYKVSTRILELQRRAQERNDITADRVLAEYSLIAFADLSKTVVPTDKDGNPDFSNISSNDRKIIGIEVKDKLKALNDLSRHLGLFEADNEQKSTIAVDFEEINRELERGEAKRREWHKIEAERMEKYGR